VVNKPIVAKTKRRCTMFDYEEIQDAARSLLKSKKRSNPDATTDDLFDEMVEELTGRFYPDKKILSFIKSYVDELLEINCKPKDDNNENDEYTMD
jgi:hypothetical protein